MRLLVAGCATAVVACVAVVGAVLAHKSSVLPPEPSPEAAIPAAAPAAMAPPKDGRRAGRRTRHHGRSGHGCADRGGAGRAREIDNSHADRPGTSRRSPGSRSAGRSSAGASCPGNPNALGVARTVEIDTTGGPGFGFEHFKEHDFLREGEVVLTFDDGPWPKNTQAVLAALAAHCTKAIFFPIGLHATYEPGIMKQVAAAGHAVGSHTWCHQDLSKTKGKCQIKGKTEAYDYDPKDEIEKGISAVRWAVGGPTAPYFRFPGTAATAGAHRLSRQAQHRHVLHRLRFLRLQDAQARAGPAGDHDEVEETRQRHCADA